MTGKGKIDSLLTGEKFKTQFALIQDLKNLLNLNFSKYALTTFILKKPLLILKAHPCARNMLLNIS